MQVTLINGTSGVGKTTLLHSIPRPPNSAILDGDDVAQLQPFEGSPRWVNLVHDNLLACAVNMRRAGVAQLLIGFVFPGEWAYRHLETLFRSENFVPVWINLVADDDCLISRQQTKGVTRQDIFDLSIEFNAEIRGLAQVHDLVSIDTTELNTDSVCLKVLEVVAERKEQPSWAP